MGKQVKSKTPALQPTKTEFTPEPEGVPVTTEQQQEEALKKEYAMYAAACDREITRIKRESGVRIGQSVIPEASLADAVVEALLEARDKYLVYADAHGKDVKSSLAN